MSAPFTEAKLEDRLAWYEKAIRENLERANAATQPDERAHHLQQAAIAQAIIIGLLEAAAMVGVDIGPFA